MNYSTQWYRKYGHAYKTYYRKNKSKILKRFKRWAKNNPDKIKVLRARHYHRHKKLINQKSQTYNKKRKLLVLRHYGGNKASCRRCGIEDVRCLDIDHVSNNGGSQRKKLGVMGSGFYGWLIKNKFPRGFQVLCRNCNWIKHINRLEQRNEEKKV